MTDGDPCGDGAVRQGPGGCDDPHELDVLGNALAADTDRVHRHAERRDLGKLLGRNTACRVFAVRGKNDRGQRFGPGATDDVDQRVADRCRRAVGLQVGKALDALGAGSQGEELRRDVAAGNRLDQVVTRDIQPRRSLAVGHAGGTVGDEGHDVLAGLELFGPQGRLHQHDNHQRNHRQLQKAERHELPG